MKEFIALLQQGGIIMYPLLLCSVISLAIVIERCFTLRHKHIIVPEIEKVVRSIRTAEDIPLALKVCSQNKGPFAAIMRVGLENHTLPAAILKEEITNHGRQQVRVLERGLVVLETVAAVSPILGLLGTVVGMIKVFKVISLQGVGEASALSGGISEALITTAAGLTVAIPTVIFYNFLSQKAENLIMDIEDNANNLVRTIRKFSKDA